RARAPEPAPRTPRPPAATRRASPCSPPRRAASCTKRRLAGRRSGTKPQRSEPSRGACAWHAHAPREGSLLGGFVPELLPANRRFVHEAALRGGEHGEALLVAAGGRGVLGAGSGARARAAGARLRRRPGGDRDRARLRAELE